ncbi:MFS transporter [Nocardioides sp. SYSU DS0651]|uniref:MFS transporter n=1 Tax=Nocardioides sp. SYSU DS0651 TaxID=3415955 RepID=UPI003F4C4B20
MLAGLCLTEVVSWGVLYYAFPVLAPGIAAETGWSLSATSAAFSAGLVTSAVVGIPVGRVLDRNGPWAVMTAGSVLAGLAVGLIAWSPNLAVFALAWAVAGVAMAGVLYQPAFAALTRWYGPRHLPALATLTLVAGLASTVFAPVTAALDARLGWREVYLVLGLALLVITVPAHALALRRPWPADPVRHDDAQDAGEYAATVRSDARFRLLVLGLTTASLAMYAALISLVPLLLERGISAPVAAWALGLGGVGQVVGRIGYTVTAHRVGLRLRTGLVFTLSAASIAALAIAPGDPAVLIALAMVAGVARGIATLLHATAITDRWGPRAYARLSGLLSAPVVLASALAPWAGAAVADLTGSYATTYGLLAAIATVGAALMIASTRAPASAEAVTPGRRAGR